jgi:hypothetical protein
LFLNFKCDLGAGVRWWKLALHNSFFQTFLARYALLFIVFFLSLGCLVFQIMAFFLLSFFLNSYFRRHSNHMVLPNVLKAADPPIHFRTITQAPENIVVVFPGAVYLVVDTGLICSEEAFFGMKDTRCDEFQFRYATMTKCRCNIRPTALRALYNMTENSFPNSLSLRIANLPRQLVAGKTARTVTAIAVDW